MTLFAKMMLLLSAMATPVVAQNELPAVRDIIDRSSQATHKDWEKAPEFDFCETRKNAKGSSTSLVTMIAGSPLRRLVAVNDRSLTSDEAQKQAAGFDAAVRQRPQESPQQRQKRVSQYENVRLRDQLLLEEFSQGMSFSLKGTGTMSGHKTFIVSAAPKPGYSPKTTQTTVLKAMRGTMWIDQDSYRWVKVQAEVTDAVTIEGFLAKVEPGTRFAVEMRPVGDGSIWLPSRFSTQSRVVILLLFPKSSAEDVTYFHYSARGSLSPESCLAP